MPVPGRIEHGIRVGDGSLHVVESGNGPPLLMIHGWPLDHRMFDRQVDTLEQRFRCIAVDRRGFGLSTAQPDMRRELDDLDTILDALDLAKVHMFGVSQGGRIALRYAATRPERLRSLVLQGAVVDGLGIEEPGAERVPVAEYAELAKAGELNAVKSAWLAHPMMQLPRGHRREKELLELIVAGYSGADLRAYDPDHYAFQTDVLAALGASAIPVLLLTGAKETEARRSHAATIRRRVLNCREIIFEASGHLPNLTEAEVLNDKLADFIDAVERNSA